LQLNHTIQPMYVTIFCNSYISLLFSTSGSHKEESLLPELELSVGNPNEESGLIISPTSHSYLVSTLYSKPIC